MRNKILIGGTWIRGVFLLLGLWMIIRTAMDGEWPEIVLGSWLAAMGLFGFGCAAGKCFSGNCEVKAKSDAEK